jgi:hypothetical protein
MAASTDVTKKVADKSQKRDVDYLSEWAGYLTAYENAKHAAEKAGTGFDDSAVMASIKASLGVSAIDAELSAKA